MTSNNMSNENESTVETAPDPGEDDLDELDDILDQFSNTKVGSSPTTDKPETQVLDGKSVTSQDTTRQADSFPSDSIDDVDHKEFEQQMRIGMAEMLRQLEGDPALAKQFEDMMTNLGAPAPPDVSKGTSDTTNESSPRNSGAQATSSNTALAGDAGFQETIQRTMDRMRQSAASANAASQSKSTGSTGNPTEEDLMSALLSELSSGLGGAGEGGDESFSQLLLSMMEQLTNKEILYEPMKELNSKFPAWLDERKPGAPKASELDEVDRKRYEEQQRLVKQIVERFEKPSYSDDNPPDREYIVERMQKMQAAGAPPPDLVGDMEGAEAMLGNMDESCPTQ